METGGTSAVMERRRTSSNQGERRVVCRESKSGLLRFLPAYEEGSLKAGRSEGESPPESRPPERSPWEALIICVARAARSSKLEPSSERDWLWEPRSPCVPVSCCRPDKLFWGLTKPESFEPSLARRFGARSPMAPSEGSQVMSGLAVD